MVLITLVSLLLFPDVSYCVPLSREQHFTEVPVTSEPSAETWWTCKNCESDCHLAGGVVLVHLLSAVAAFLLPVLGRAVCAFHVYPQRNWRIGCLSERVLSVQLSCLLQSLFFFNVYFDYAGSQCHLGS